MPTDRPNILLVTTDQQRFDAAGERAPSALRTPHYGTLCRQGVEFEAAYASSPKCVPSRAELMTGRSVFARADAENTADSYAYGLEGQAEMLPTRLGEAGYATAAVGKMHFDPPRARHGFDEMVLPHEYYDQRHRSDGRQPMRHGLGQNEIHPGRSTVPEDETLTAWIAEECVDYVRRRRDPTVPFFLWCSFSKPHPPLDPPEPYCSMYQNVDLPTPVEGDWTDPLPEVVRRHPWVNRTPQPSPETVEAARAAYYGLITHVDYSVGRVLAALRETGLLENTLVIYTSDHGCYLGDHGLFNKMYFHDVAARVPMVVRPPTSWDDRPTGKTATPVTLADVLPTVLAAAGGSIPAGCDGRDLLGAARGDGGREYVMGASATVSPCDYLAITDGRWKYIYYPDGPERQLFDLSADPYETENLTGHEMAGTLHEELRERLVERDSEFLDGEELPRFEAGTSVDPSFPEDATEQTWEGLVTDYFVDGDIRH